MKKPVTYTLLVAAAIQTSLSSAQAGAYNFGGNCPSQGAWTQMALQQTQQIAAAVRQLKDNPGLQRNHQCGGQFTSGHCDARYP